MDIQSKVKIIHDPYAKPYLFKGQQDLQEVVEAWAQAPHIMSKHFKEAVKDRPKDFMGKFLSGHD